MIVIGLSVTSRLQRLAVCILIFCSITGYFFAGTILNVETTFMKVCEGFKRKSDLDPEKTCWTEDKSDMRKYTQIIRVFFLKGKSVNEELGDV